MSEPAPIEVLCPECGVVVRVSDVQTFVLGLHERVCLELEAVNGVSQDG